MYIHTLINALAKFWNEPVSSMFNTVSSPLKFIHCGWDCGTMYWIYNNLPYILYTHIPTHWIFLVLISNSCLTQLACHTYVTHILILFMPTHVSIRIIPLTPQKSRISHNGGLIVINIHENKKWLLVSKDMVSKTCPACTVIISTSVPLLVWQGQITSNNQLPVASLPNRRSSRHSVTVSNVGPVRKL